MYDYMYRYYILGLYSLLGLVFGARYSLINLQRPPTVVTSLGPELQLWSDEVGFQPRPARLFDEPLKSRDFEGSFKGDIGPSKAKIGQDWQYLGL